MGKSKQSNQDAQSSQPQGNGSGVGNQFQPNQGLGSIDDTKTGKRQAKHHGRPGKPVDDFDEEENDENEQEIETFDEGDGDDIDVKKTSK